jgi:chemotaxis protein CheY-P-specific phosphatase CheC
MKSNVIAIAKTIKGTSYVSINNYVSSSSGETASYLIVAGYSHQNALEHDFKALSDFKPYQLASEFPIDGIMEAYNELMSSFLKRLANDKTKDVLLKSGDSTLIRSKAQSDAYVQLAAGVKKHVLTNELYVYGLVVRKVVIEEGTFKEVKSSQKTIIKNRIKKLCNFRESKIREFKVTNGTIKIKGQTI